MLDLKKLAPPIIAYQDTWSEFLDAVKLLLIEVQTEVEKKKKYHDIDRFTDREELLSLARSYGYEPNLILKSDLDYLKQEVKSIVFKIRNKSTYYYYNYIFKLIPYPGETFILFQDYLKLVRAIDQSTTLDALSLHDLTTPFTNVTSALHYDTYQDRPVELDASSLFYLDALVQWYLDQDIIIKPTNHLAIEYMINQLVEDGGEEYLLTDNYFDYLKTAADYGRKITNVPHAGGCLSLPISQEGHFDDYHTDTTVPQYSIPTIKTSCSITSFYSIQEDRDLIYLDDGNELDESTAWYLDNDEILTIEKSIEERAQYLKVGTGSKSFYSKQHTELTKDVLYHTSFEDPNTTSLTDLSPNDNVTTIIGDYSRVTGVSGKTVRLNGINTTVEVEDFISSNSTQTWCFWVYGDSSGQLINTPRVLHQNNFINVYYNNSEQKFYVTLIGASASQTVTFNGNVKEKKYFFLIEIDNSNDKLRLYVNDSLQDVEDISGIGIYNSDKSIWIGSQAQANYFRGYVDEFRIYNKLLESGDKSYLYDRKLGSLQYLSNEIYTKELSTNQIYDGSKWYNIGFWYPANSVAGEVIMTGDGSTQTLSTILDYNQLSENYFSVRYYSFPDWYTASDDGRGNITGNAATGSIDYTTGELSLTFSRSYDVLREVISEEPINEYKSGLDHTNVTKNSFSIVYWIGDNEYTGTDDGNGNVTGTGISSGTINYSNGYIDITFTTDTDSGKDVYVAYEYTNYSIPDDGALVKATYKVDHDLEITEAGIADEDGNLTMYAAFPPVKFKNLFNHMSFQFFIRK